MLRFLSLIGAAVLITGCVTTQTPTKNTDVAVVQPKAPAPVPVPTPPVKPPGTPDAPPTAPVLPIPATPRVPDGFAQLPLWDQNDPTPALSAYVRNCDIWKKKDADQLLSKAHPQYGKLTNWTELCPHARVIGTSPQDARRFFETHFYPLTLEQSPQVYGAKSGKRDLLTGYYQPEVPVRAVPDTEFSEPILTVPANKANQKLARADIRPHMSRVIGYGRTIDVFFMQVQGSGILVFDNGYRVRAAYDGNNGHSYTSIGTALIRRGELESSKAGMQDLEDWMTRNGPEATRDLLNANKRYIFFREEALVPGEGPMGGMRAPLTAMGSLAVDDSEHPYGLPIWINVKLPQFAGDYRGTEEGLLVIAQDTGKAIRGPQRGDIYFGSGPDAGAKAGVMKHRGAWSILVPRSVMKLPPIT